MRRADLLMKAKDIVTQDREGAYGGPEDGFERIGKMWGAYLNRPPIGAAHVAAMLALLKISRLAASDARHMDSWIDLAGYAACGAECVDPEPPPP